MNIEALGGHIYGGLKACCCCCCTHAGRLVSEMRGGVTANTDPKSITPQQAVRLHQLLHEVGSALCVRLSHCWVGLGSCCPHC
jgi:hypothetical protein